jgi:hypothetical protein
LFKTVAKPTEWIPAINGKVIPNAPSFGGAFGKDKAQEWLNNWLEKHGFSDYLDETCSAGTTCAGSVATVSTPMKSKKKRKLTFAESLFLDMVKDGKDATSLVGSDHYKLKDGYLYKNAQLVKTKNLNEMVEFILGNIELPLLEGFIPEHLDMLLEDENMDNDLTPEQRQLKQQEEKELENTLQSSNEVKVSITDKNDPKNIEMNQQLLGVDDTDEQNKKFIVKNPSNNEIKIKSSEEIELEK